MSPTNYYLTQNDLARAVDSMSDRDLQVIVTLATVRFATTQHLQRIVFTSGTPLSNIRVCNRVLARLHKLHVVAHLDRQFGGDRPGSNSYVYYLDRAGHIIAQRQIGRSHKPWLPGGMFIKHMLALTEVYASCKEAEIRGLFTVKQFEMEPACWRKTSSMSHKYVKPDAYIELAAGGYRYHYFIEMDMATEIGSRISEKLTQYIEYRATGREQTAHTVFPGVRFLVPHERRRDQLQQIISRLPEYDQKIFQVALQSEVLLTLIGGL
jgi:hypothetical protein